MSRLRIECTCMRNKVQFEIDTYDNIATDTRFCQIFVSIPLYLKIFQSFRTINKDLLFVIFNL